MLGFSSTRTERMHLFYLSFEKSLADGSQLNLVELLSASAKWRILTVPLPKVARPTCRELPLDSSGRSTDSPLITCEHLKMSATQDGCESCSLTQAACCRSFGCFLLDSDLIWFGLVYFGQGFNWGLQGRRTGFQCCHVASGLLPYGAECVAM